jgi:hypothetical protein
MEICDDKIKQIVGEVMDIKLSPIDKRLDNIDTKLHNHLEHNAFQIGQIMIDISWLKTLIEKNGKSGDSLKNIAQDANIDWLKWGVRLIVGQMIISAIAVVFLIIQYFVK